MKNKKTSKFTTCSSIPPLDGNQPSSIPARSPIIESSIVSGGSEFSLRNLKGSSSRKRLDDRLRNIKADKEIYDSALTNDDSDGTNNIQETSVEE